MPNLVGIDFETYWADDYTLSKMSTRDYIMDRRFETIGVSIQVNANPPVWLSDLDEISIFLKTIDWADAYVYGHNLMFDGGILTWRYQIRPLMWLDTLSMARAIVRPFTGSAALGVVGAYVQQTGVGGLSGAFVRKGSMAVQSKNLAKHMMSAEFLRKYGEYCKDDVLLSGMILKRLMPQFTFRELQKIDRVLRMYLEPLFVLDADILADHVMEVKNTKLQLLEACGPAQGSEQLREDIMSNEKFAAVLGQFVEVPTKTSPRTGKETWALAKKDLEFSALLEHEDPRVQALVAARLGIKSTIAETRAAKLFQVATTHETLAVTLNYAGAHTGRFSGGGDENLQNLPNGSCIRNAIKAPRGRLVVAADAMQIEARVLAVWANHTTKAKLFAEGADVYAYTASQIYQKEITKETHPFERKVGKVADLQLGYGSGAGTFWHMCKTQDVDISPREAEVITDAWRAENKPIVRAWYAVFEFVKAIFLARRERREPFKWVWIGYDRAHKCGYIELPNGYKMWYPESRVDEDKFGQRGFGYSKYRRGGSDFKILWHGEIINNIIQGLAGVITNDHGMTISDYAAAPWKLQVHDELVFIPRIVHADRVAAACQLVMSIAPDWAPDIPLAAEVKTGPSYGELTQWHQKTKT